MSDVTRIDKMEWWLGQLAYHLAHNVNDTYEASMWVDWREHKAQVAALTDQLERAKVERQQALDNADANDRRLQAQVAELQGKLAHNTLATVGHDANGNLSIDFSGSAVDALKAQVEKLTSVQTKLLKTIDMFLMNGGDDIKTLRDNLDAISEGKDLISYKE